MNMRKLSWVLLIVVVVVAFIGALAYGSFELSIGSDRIFGMEEVLSGDDVAGHYVCAEYSKPVTVQDSIENRFVIDKDLFPSQLVVMDAITVMETNCLGIGTYLSDHVSGVWRDHYYYAKTPVCRDSITGKPVTYSVSSVRYCRSDGGAESAFAAYREAFGPLPGDGIPTGVEDVISESEDTQPGFFARLWARIVSLWNEIFS